MPLRSHDNCEYSYVQGHRQQLREQEPINTYKYNRPDCVCVCVAMLINQKERVYVAPCLLVSPFPQ